LRSKKKSRQQIREKEDKKPTIKIHRTSKNTMIRSVMSILFGKREPTPYKRVFQRWKVGKEMRHDQI